MKLLQTIQELAVSQPETVAFISDTKQIKYRELWGRSDQIAVFLKAQNLTDQSPILVYGHMVPEMLISFLGCVKAGHPYIPIDTSIPLERVANIIENSKTELVINVSGLPLPIVYPSIRIVNQREIENDDNNA